MKTMSIVVLAWGLMVLTAQAASFDCAKASSAVEQFVCIHPKISTLDTTLGQNFKEALSRATDAQKQRLVAEQRNWLKYMRNVCKDETCFKHAYWSRQAELETFFGPQSPLYAHESDKAEAIEKLLATVPLNAFPQGPNFCAQALTDLKSMHDVRFLDPIVQAQSYADPALVAWRRRYERGHPLHFEYECDPNLYPGDITTIAPMCAASYGLPPFKIFKLDKVEASPEPIYVFYYDGVYEPMNQNWRKSSRSNSGAFEKLGLPAPMPNISFVPTGGPNYNSIVEYHGEDFFLTVARRDTKDYWVSFQSAAMIVSGGGYNCSWVPLTGEAYKRLLDVTKHSK